MAPIRVLASSLAIVFALAVAACGDTRGERALSGGLAGGAGGAVVGGPPGAVIGGAAGAATGAAMDRDIDEAVGTD
jgi:osmotically inducible lipoprotein OsmB